jgi:hypothetical protein
MEYYQWLVDTVIPTSDNRYNLLLKELHKIPFEIIMKNDHNRVMDAVLIRRDFKKEFLNIMEESSENSASFFEVSIALAMRMYDIMYGDEQNVDIDGWFWILMRNLELDRYDDNHFNYDKVCEIVRKCMKRRYSFNGEGGFFPLKNTKKDQRKVEIWYQLSEFLEENFEF